MSDRPKPPAKFSIRYADRSVGRHNKRLIGPPSIWLGDRLFMRPDFTAEKIRRKLDEAYAMGVEEGKKQ